MKRTETEKLLRCVTPFLFSSGLISYHIRVCVKEVKGHCAMCYKSGDHFLVKRYYVRNVVKGVCLDALASMFAFLHPS